MYCAVPSSQDASLGCRFEHEQPEQPTKHTSYFVAYFGRVGATRFVQPLYFCLGGQASQLRTYPNINHCVAGIPFIIHHCVCCGTYSRPWDLTVHRSGYALILFSSSSLFSGGVWSGASGDKCAIYYTPLSYCSMQLCEFDVCYDTQELHCFWPNHF